MILDRNADQGNEAASSIGPNVAFNEVDVTNEESCKKAVAATVAKFGRLDGVINCAGIGSATTTIGPKGDRRANVVDKATGKIIFDGDIATDEQRQALPKEVQDQLKDLDKIVVERPMGARNVRAPQLVFGGGGKNVRGGAPGNNLPKPKSVSGSDDDYTWEFTTKTDENGKPELELLLLDKNGKILFQGPFSRTRDIPTLPAPIAERFNTSPWKIVIDDLKSTGGGNVLNLKLAAPGQPAAPAAGGPDNNFAPAPKAIAAMLHRLFRGNFTRSVRRPMSDRSGRERSHSDQS